MSRGYVIPQGTAQELLTDETISKDIFGFVIILSPISRHKSVYLPEWMEVLFPSCRFRVFVICLA